MIGETVFCLTLKLATAWGLAPEGACVLDCDITNIYRHAISDSLVISGPFSTCDRTTIGDTKDELGAFPVVYMPEDGTWHWLREQDPIMCSKEAKP